MDTNRSRVRLLGVCLAGLISAVTTAAAQERGQPNESASMLGGLEEIVVTARKREEALKDVPISISVMTGEQLEARGIGGPRDLFESSASLNMNDFTGSRKDARLGIRGVQGDESFVTRQKISSFIDGIPISGQTGALNMLGLKNVEIARGPQSASYGRATFAGAINYITEDSADQFEVKVRAGGTEHGGKEGGLTVSGPLGDNFGYRAMYYRNEWKGPSEWVTTNGDQLGSQQTDFFVGKLNFRFGERTNGELMYQHSNNQDRDYPGVVANPAVCNGDSSILRLNMSASVRLWNDLYLDCDVDLSPRGTGLPYNPNLLGQFVAQYDPAKYGGVPLATYLARTLPDGTTYEQALLRNTINNPFDSMKRDRIQGELNFEVGDSVIKLMGMTSKETSFFWADRDLSDSVGVFVVGRTGAILDSNVVTRGDKADITEKYGELRWISSDSQPIRYVASASWLKYDYTQTIHLGYGAIAYGLKLPNGNPVDPILQNLVQESAENLGFSGGVQWDITPRLTASLEGRYQTDDVCGSDPTGNGGAGFKVCQKTEAFMPRLSGTFKFTDDVSFFFQLARGNNPASTNTQLGNDNYRNSLAIANGTRVNPADGFTYNGSNPKRVPKVTYNADTYVTYNEERLDNLELGIKGNFPDRRGNYAITLYHMTWSDMQNRTQLDWNAINVCVNGVVPSPITGCPGGDANTLFYGWNNSLSNPFTQSATIVNAGEAKLKGIEIEAQYALTDSLAIGGNVVFSSQKYGDYCSLEALQYSNLPASITFITHPVLGRCALVNGNDISGVTGGGIPSFVVNGNVDYLVPFQPFGSDWKVGLDVHHEGDKFIDELNLMKQRGFTTVALSSEWRTDRLSVRAFVNNLTNEDSFQTYNNLRRYFVTNPANPAASIAGAPGAYTLIPRRPREFGITVNYRFGGD